MTAKYLHATPTQSHKPKLSALWRVYWHLRIWGVTPAEIGKVDFNGNVLPRPCAEREVKP